MKIPFEEAYVLHMSNAKTRYDILSKNLEEYDVKDYFKVWWTTKRFENKDMLKSCGEMETYVYNIVKRTSKKHVYSSVFNCTYEHYSIIKQAYERGIKSILIIEDDVVLTGNKYLIQKIFDNIPQDYNIIRFCVISSQNRYTNNGKYFIKDNNRSNWGLQAYALDRNGMEYYINFCNSAWKPADFPLCALPNTQQKDSLNMYFCNYEIFKTNEEGNNSNIG